jgi:hypothetical protein
MDLEFDFYGKEESDTLQYSRKIIIKIVSDCAFVKG